MVADKQGSVVKCINDGQSGAKAEHSRCECLCAAVQKKHNETIDHCIVLYDMMFVIQIKQQNFEINEIELYCIA